MRYIRSFGLFWWDYIVGDDWRVAAGLALAFGLTWLLAHNGIAAWWLLPLAVAVLLSARSGASRVAVAEPGRAHPIRAAGCRALAKKPKPADLSALGLRLGNHFIRRDRCQLSSEPPAPGWSARLARATRWDVRGLDAQQS
jgi:hypothetical protein